MTALRQHGEHSNEMQGVGGVEGGGREGGGAALFKRKKDTGRSPNIG